MTAILHLRPRSLLIFLHKTVNFLHIRNISYVRISDSMVLAFSSSIKEIIEFQQIDKKLCVWEHHREDKRKVLKLRSGPRSQFTVGEFTREKRNGFNKKEGPAILFFGDQFWRPGSNDVLSEEFRKDHL